MLNGAKSSPNDRVQLPSAGLGKFWTVAASVSVYPEM